MRVSLLGQRPGGYVAFSEHRTSGAVSEPFFEANGSVLGSQGPRPGWLVGGVFCFTKLVDVGARYKHARWNPRGWKVNFQVRVLDLQYVFIDKVRLGRD